MKLKLIACEIMFRELCHCVAQSRSIVDFEFLPKGLHDIETADMVARLQECIDQADGEGYEAIALAYALCNNGTVGLRARSAPVVLPRAHDCITLLLGSKERYRDYFKEHPGTFFRSPGWMERDFANVEGSIYQKLGLAQEYQEMVEKYGEDNAQFIMESMGGWRQHYTDLLYIDTGGAQQLDYEAEARKEAEQNGWAFRTAAGDLGLLQRLVDGEWSESEFLVLRPGEAIAATLGNEIICTAKCG